MKTVLEVARYGSEHIYDDKFRWDKLVLGANVADCRIGVKLDPADGTAIIAFRGSTTPHDFLKDAQAAFLTPAGKLGWLALGFFEGVADAYPQLRAAVPAGYRVLVTGHSLGAAQAVDFAGYCMTHGWPLDAPPVLMGCPRPGLTNLQRSLADMPQPYSFRNGTDPVCDAPPWCEEPAQFVHLNEPPAANDPWGTLIGQHHWELYLQGIAKLTALLPVAA